MQAIERTIAQYTHRQTLDSTLAFVPSAEIKEVIPLLLIRDALLETGASPNDADSRTDAILSKLWKTFLTLVYIKSQHLLLCFLDSTWDDSNLPLLRNTDLRAFGLAINDEVRTRFESSQWMFLAPEFRSLGEHLILDDCAVLPFLEYQTLEDTFVDQTIYRAKIHRLYQSFYNPSEVSLFFLTV